MKHYKTSYAKKYLITIVSFLFAVFSIVVVSGFTSKKYDYKESAANDFFSLGTGIQIALVNKEYNPQKELLRLDFKLKQTDQTTLLSKIKINVEGNYITNKNQKLTYKSVRVTDDYIVIYFNEVPKEYSVFSSVIQINEKSVIKNSLQDSQNDPLALIKFYVNDTKEIENLSLKEEKKTTLFADYIEEDLKGIKKRIKNNEKEINDLILTIGNFEEEILNLKSELDYQTESEKEVSQQNISSKENDLNNFRNEIIKKEKENKELQHKIKLLKDKFK